MFKISAAKINISVGLCKFFIIFHQNLLAFIQKLVLLQKLEVAIRN